jgi:MarR family transcriptional regulator, transcriptional regulator for hemolysin
MHKYDFENNIGFIVNRTAKAFVKALDSELREKVGLTVGQWKVVVTLVNENGLTQKEIADRLGLEGPTLIPVIDKMENDGLVARRVDQDDRRNNRIYRTENADALWDRMMKCATRVRQVSVKDIPEEDIRIMKNVLEKIWQNLGLEFDVGCNVSITKAVADSTAKIGVQRNNAAVNPAAIKSIGKKGNN